MTEENNQAKDVTEPTGADGWEKIFWAMIGGGLVFIVLFALNAVNQVPLFFMVIVCALALSFICGIMGWVGGTIGYSVGTKYGRQIAGGRIGAFLGGLATLAIGGYFVGQFISVYLEAY